jgi:hypothetical protein
VFRSLEYSGLHRSQTQSPAGTPKFSQASSQGLPTLSPFADWLLMVSESSVRLYPISAAHSGVRKTHAKVKLDYKVDAARVLDSDASQPLLLAWSATDGLQVRPACRAYVLLADGKQAACASIWCARGAQHFQQAARCLW